MPTNYYQKSTVTKGRVLLILNYKEVIILHFLIVVMKLLSSLLRVPTLIKTRDKQEEICNTYHLKI